VSGDDPSPGLAWPGLQGWLPVGSDHPVRSCALCFAA